MSLRIGLDGSRPDGRAKARAPKKAMIIDTAVTISIRRGDVGVACPRGWMRSILFRADEVIELGWIATMHESANGP
jgi:hypothetical protein